MSFPKKTVTIPTQQHCLNAPLAVAEVIDGEAVIMNMDTGHYFSARGLAGVLWEWTIAGHSVAAVSSIVTEKWPEPGIDEDVAAFVASLEQHNLVVATSSAVAVAPIDPAKLNMPTYAAPTLDVFTDMKDLLLLDPIHDVGEAGWPMPRDASATP